MLHLKYLNNAIFCKVTGIEVLRLYCHMQNFSPVEHFLFTAYQLSIQHTLTHDQCMGYATLVISLIKLLYTQVVDILDIFHLKLSKGHLHIVLF